MHTSPRFRGAHDRDLQRHPELGGYDGRPDGGDGGPAGEAHEEGARGLAPGMQRSGTSSVFFLGDAPNGPLGARRV